MVTMHCQDISEVKITKLYLCFQVSSMGEKFSAHYDSVEQEIKANTVNHVTKRKHITNRKPWTSEQCCEF
jgi:hypothetical protein